MAKKKKAVLPNTLYVKLEDAGDGEYYPSCDDSLESWENGDEIGVYKLVSTGKLNITRDLDIE